MPEDGRAGKSRKAGLDDWRAHPLKFRPAFAGGLCVREVYGGTCGWTKACRQAGIPALEPVELFEDPVRGVGPTA